MSFGHLQRAPRTKREFKDILADWDRLSSEAGEAKRRANQRGTDSEVRPYLERMRAINSARNAWLDRYDSGYSRLPD